MSEQALIRKKVSGRDQTLNSSGSLMIRFFIFMKSLYPITLSPLYSM